METSSQSVLRCDQCNKPFDKESTLKRHGYYCRSRRIGKTKRTRSCICCAKVKARCDHQRPQCSRCSAKAIQCRYPSETPTRESGVSQDGVESTRQPGLSSVGQNDVDPARQDTTASWDARSATNYPSTSGVLDSTSASMSLTTPPNFTLLDEALDWNVPDLDLPGLLFPDASNGIGQSPHLDLSGPAYPPSGSRTLIQRSDIMKRGQRVTTMILSTLKSFPFMIQLHDRLPPFIHPHLVSSLAEDDEMESLTNCMSLMRIRNSSVKSSRKLLWRNVRMECERMGRECRKLNKWGLLGAVQALAIYLLVRLDEGETEHNSVDMLLITTVAAITQEFAAVDRANRQSSTQPGFWTWKKWLFEESKRRTCAVYRIINLLFHFEPADLCEMHKELAIAPLPTTKKLWEAEDEVVWKEECKKEPRVQVNYAVAVNGDLIILGSGHKYCTEVELHEGAPSYPIVPKGQAKWEEWCSGMDGFGGLIMLAASLIG